MPKKVETKTTVKPSALFIYNKKRKSKKTFLRVVEIAIAVIGVAAAGLYLYITIKDLI